MTKQAYLGDTAVLATRFMAEESTGSVIDFMPVSEPELARDPHTIVRVVQGVRGRTRFRMSCAPRFHHGRASHTATVTPARAVFESGGTGLVLHAGVPSNRSGTTWWRRSRSGRARTSVSSGRRPGSAMLTPSVNVMQSSFPEHLQGEISGLSRSVSNLESSLGAAIAGTILVAGLTSDPKRSYALAMVVLAIIGIAGLVASIFLPPKLSPATIPPPPPGAPGSSDDVRPSLRGSNNA